MPLEQHVTVDLLGQSYTFKAESETINAQQVADYLVKEVEKIEAQQHGQQLGLSKLNIMILAAMNIANENVELKKRHSDLYQELSKRSLKLIKRLDDHLLS